MNRTIIPINDDDDDISILSYDDLLPASPSLIPSNIVATDDNKYETDSDHTGYDENMDFKVIHMRRPSIIRKTLSQFRKSIDNQQSGSLVGSTLIPMNTRLSFFQRLKKKIYIPIVITFILTGIIVASV
jgi:hypothetical protein